MEGHGAHGYTVSDLEALTGINRRTIHFYVKQGVLPAPQGAGGGARYGEEHLLRLQLTRELQKSHLKLSGIKEAMDRLSLEQMRAMAKKAGVPSKPWDMRALEDWVQSRVHRSLAGPAWNRSMLDLVSEPSPPDRQGLAGKPASAAGRSPPGAGESWERIRIADGFEVLLRGDVAASYRALVRDLAGRASRQAGK
jgi:DNA-binding transcriptional MerR regulator